MYNRAYEGGYHHTGNRHIFDELLESNADTTGPQAPLYLPLLLIRES